MAVGVFIHVYDLRAFFGGDAYAYDTGGAAIANVWQGLSTLTAAQITQNSSGVDVGWGMNYFVGIIYYIFGRNIFAAQSICAVIGAATAPMVYFCANKIFHNIQVAKISAVLTALFPAFVIWSSQLLKDGLIVFLLVLAMTMVLQLQERRINYPAIGLLVFSLLGVLALRFYIFYMVIVAVVGSFIIGSSSTTGSVVRRTVILVLMGLGLTYFGVGRRTNLELGMIGSLDRVQGSRYDLSKSAESGFGEDVDVSTTEGAISALPLGLAYLMFAPFPWAAINPRQAVTIPETLVWWGLIPFLISGLIYTVKNKLRTAFPILIFSLLLTIAYSIFQGNVGTAYRQRTQIQVFFFILIGVGWTLFKEKRENKRLQRSATQRMLEAQIRARA
jgi:4-amino-4-deoxy-L-arabinose transferase-like glycosyltransferase